MLHLDTALAATAPDLIADQRKYYSGDSIVQSAKSFPSKSLSISCVISTGGCAAAAMEKPAVASENVDTSQKGSRNQCPMNSP